MTDKSAQIQNLIYDIRGQKVMLDRDLAQLYDVEVKRLNEAVKRNTARFPSDFMFQLTQDEWNVLRSQIVTANEEDSLRSQFATSKSNRGGRRYAPYAFTEHGVLMLSNVLNSTKAISMSIQMLIAPRTLSSL